MSKKPSLSPYYSEVSGTIIKSTRPFGLEFEVNLALSGQRELQKLLSKNFDLVHDGSVNSGIEVVTPILGGDIGEKEVLKTCASLSKVGAGTDRTCGLHVHLDGSDVFDPSWSAKVYSLHDYLNLVKKNGEAWNHSAVMLHSSLLKDLKNSGSDIYNNLASYGEIDVFDWGDFDSSIRNLPNYRVILNRDQALAGSLQLVTGARVRSVNGNAGSRIPEIKPSIPHTTSRSGDIAALSKFAKSFSGETSCINNMRLGAWAVVDIDHSYGDRVVVYDPKVINQASSGLKRLIRIASFYTTYEDVIMSMLPATRRFNDYTKRITSHISIDDIISCKTHLQFFNMWSKTTSLKEFKESRKNYRHNSRYFGTNFRALLKHGTVEIRSHSGTIDADKALYWTALHQAIMDGCCDLQDERFSSGRSKTAQNIVSLEEKTNVFFKKLMLDSEVESYFMGRIEKFKTEDAGSSVEIIENDKVDLDRLKRHRARADVHVTHGDMEYTMTMTHNAFRARPFVVQQYDAMMPPDYRVELN